MPSIDQNIEKWDYKFKLYWRWRLWIQVSEAGGHFTMVLDNISRIERCLPAKHIYEIAQVGKMVGIPQTLLHISYIVRRNDQSFEFLSNKYENEKRIIVKKTNGTQLNSDQKLISFFIWFIGS